MEPKGINTGQWDQAKEGIRDLALLNFTFYKAQVEAGFTVDQALRLTVTYLESLGRNSNG